MCLGMDEWQREVVILKKRGGTSFIDTSLNGLKHWAFTLS